MAEAGGGDPNNPREVRGADVRIRTADPFRDDVLGLPVCDDVYLSHRPLYRRL
jgi:hypothetical protein